MPALTTHPRAELIARFDLLIDEEIAFLNGRLPVPTSNWQYVAVLLVGRVLQLQRAVHAGVRNGYSEELYPLARALMSTVVALVYIAHGRKRERWERKAIQYLVYGRKGRRKLLKYLVRSRWLTAAVAREHERAATTEENAFLVRAKQNGLEPLSEGNNARFWTGYDDRTLFEKMKLKRWYHHFYSPWSDDSHGQASGLVPLDEQFVGSTFNIGPHARDPWFLLLACSEFGIQSLDQLNKLFRLGRKPEVVALWKRTVTELSAAHASGLASQPSSASP